MPSSFDDFLGHLTPHAFETCSVRDTLKARRTRAALTVARSVERVEVACTSWKLRALAVTSFSCSLAHTAVTAVFITLPATSALWKASDLWVATFFAIASLLAFASYAAFTAAALATLHKAISTTYAVYTANLLGKLLAAPRKTLACTV
eukprot:IDg20480t1